MAQSEIQVLPVEVQRTVAQYQPTYQSNPTAQTRPPFVGAIAVLCLAGAIGTLVLNTGSSGPSHSQLQQRVTRLEVELEYERRRNAELEGLVMGLQSRRSSGRGQDGNGSTNN